MSTSVPDSGPAARVAERGQEITVDELGLAARNHAMPMEALRWDTTPAGLHYVLVHYDIPEIDPETWRLNVRGAVETPLELSLDSLAGMPQHTVRVTLECAGNGRAFLDPRPISQPWLTGAVGTADWTGVSLRNVLAGAGIRQEAVDVVFRGADHGTERGVEQDYERALPIGETQRPEVLLATEMNGAPLPFQHGFPVRLVVPGWYGMAHVKWLTDICILDETFTGFQNMAYRLRQDPADEGVPVTRIEPRALIRPPGFPDWMTRDRVLTQGPVELSGRAWSGWGEVTRVEVSTDDGVTWRAASLCQPAGLYAWRAFTCIWDAEVGEHRLRARATDDTGRVQPTETLWTRGGFTNNADYAIRVHVVEG